MSDITIDVVKVKSKDAKKNTKQTDSASNKVVVSPEEIRKKKNQTPTNANKQQTQTRIQYHTC